MYKTQIAVVVPVYNESARFGHVRAFYQKLIQMTQGVDEDLHVFFVNDGSTDNSRDLIDNLIKDFDRDYQFSSATQIVLAKNTQKVGVYIAASQHIDAEVYVFVDADDSFPTESILSLVKSLKRDRCEMAIAARQHKEVPVHWSRKMASSVNHFVLSWLIPKGLVDVQTGLKVYTASAVQNTFKYLKASHGFSGDFVILYQAKKQRIPVLQIPTPTVDRDGSHVRIVRDSLRYVREVSLFLLQDVAIGA